MIYAHAHDQTMAENYFKATEQVEQQLALTLNCSVEPPSASKMLSLADSLFMSVLNTEQHEILSRLRDGLSWLAEQQATAMEAKVLVDSR
jgi:hypothetical protein